MISQPPIKVIHPPLEVWRTRINARPFVVHHHIGRNAEESETRVRFRSENATKLSASQRFSVSAF